jgi:uncharacterized Fe-S cluster protein YjdI
MHTRYKKLFLHAAEERSMHSSICRSPNSEIFAEEVEPWVEIEKNKIKKIYKQILPEEQSLCQV